MKRILELGSGRKPYFEDGAEVIHLDKVKLPHIEVVWDLNKFPYPFPDNYFDEVIATHVLEHLDDLASVMKEIWRILKPGGKLKITAPHFSNYDAYRDPTHKHFFTFESFDYFDPNFRLYQEFNFYLGEDVKFRIRYKEARFIKNIKVRFKNSKLMKIYEMFFSRVFPTIEMYIELEAVK
ncbi:MAG: hypothetical protein DRP00_01425 [Candidatus Aenigmatarchaeota archaeon]|nr:MAG: hypothetical protein DRP00_01425 [Candidatus Aenigmarchaeota archaeon]